jgi:hypothetical protein
VPTRASDGRFATGSRLPDGSQLIPVTGTATSEQATVAEQPREAFSLAVQTAKSALPVPLGLVAPQVVLLGRLPEPTSSDSGAIPTHPASGVGPPR